MRVTFCLLMGILLSVVAVALEGCDDLNERQRVFVLSAPDVRLLRNACTLEICRAPSGDNARP